MTAKRGAPGSGIGDPPGGAAGEPGALEAAAPGAAGADIVGRHRRLVRRTALISVLTLFSRVLGYAREFLSALLFGHQSPVYDAFITAWRVPNLFRRLLGEGAVATALQTKLTETDADLGDEAGRRLLWDTLKVALWILIALCALVMGAASLAGDTMPGTGWRWLGADPAAVRELVVRVTPYVVFICLAGLCGGALAVRGRFAAASAGPGVMNLVAIGTLAAIGLRYGWSGLAPEDGAAGRARHLDMARVLSWGLIAAGLAQFLMLVPEMARAGLLRRRPAPPFPGSRRRAFDVLRTSAPLALGAAVYQINVMVDGFMAQALLSPGGPTTYYFANRIQQLPLALVATAATSAVFPALKALGHRRELGPMRILHDRAQLAICFFALPAAVGLFVLAEPVVAVLLQHGEFGREGVERTAFALRLLCLALVPAGAAGLVGRTYYALGDFRTPVRVSVVLLGLNLALNTLFLLGLGLDVGGLALATAVTSWANLLLLLPGLLRRLPREPGRERSWAGGLLGIAAASAACGLAAWLVGDALGRGPRSPAALAAAIAAGALTYGVACQLLAVEPWRALLARLGRRGRGSVR